MQCSNSDHQGVSRECNRSHGDEYCGDKTEKNDALGKIVPAFSKYIESQYDRAYFYGEPERFYSDSSPHPESSLVYVGDTTTLFYFGDFIKTKTCESWLSKIRDKPNTARELCVNNPSILKYKPKYNSEQRDVQFERMVEAVYEDYLDTADTVVDKKKYSDCGLENFNCIDFEQSINGNKA